MKNIQFESLSAEGLTISYNDGGDQDMQTERVLITEPKAIQAIMVLGKALQKESFLNINPA